MCMLVWCMFISLWASQFSHPSQLHTGYVKIIKLYIIQLVCHHAHCYQPYQHYKINLLTNMIVICKLTTQVIEPVQSPSTIACMAANTRNTCNIGQQQFINSNQCKQAHCQLPKLHFLKLVITHLATKHHVL